jgi:predicted ATPase
MARWKPTFRVVKPRTSVEATSREPEFVLEQDRWDDFGFKTTYNLWFIDKKHEATRIGAVGILRQGQTAGSELELEAGSRFVALDRAFCSLGHDLDYYQRLAGLSTDIRNVALSGLRDVIRYPLLKRSFKKERGWKDSLLRGRDERDAIFTLAPVILSGRYETLPGEELQFKFQPKGWGGALKFNFHAPNSQDGFRRLALPERIAVLVGRNGAGKSTVLARIARVAHAARQERGGSVLSALGKFDPPGLGFPRIVAISYSPFDSFRVPGLSDADRKQISKDLTKGEGRFVFCGVRDIVAEAAAELGRALRTPEMGDRQSKTLLKPIEALAREYVTTLRLVKRRSRLDLLKKALEPLLREPSFHDVKDDLGREIEHAPTERAFLRWGTGHKIAVQVLLNLVAYCEPRSLVLFDEPETHLHPPLLAALMHGMRWILNETQAFAIVATHSPVVLQETLSGHICILVRQGGQITVVAPQIEVFGENIGLITAEVFGLTSEVTDYHEILDGLVAGRENIDRIEALFERGLSTQARAYVMTRLAERKVKSRKK